MRYCSRERGSQGCACVRRIPASFHFVLGVSKHRSDRVSPPMNPKYQPDPRASPCQGPGAALTWYLTLDASLQHERASLYMVTRVSHYSQLPASPHPATAMTSSSKDTMFAEHPACEIWNQVLPVHPSQGPSQGQCQRSLSQTGAGGSSGRAVSKKSVVEFAYKEKLGRMATIPAYQGGAAI